METLLSPDGSLTALCAAAFVAATIVPFSSEAALYAVLKLHPNLFWAAIAVASVGNTAGGMTTFAIGRWLAQAGSLKHLDQVRRWGAPITALGWLPVAGDALCLAAGWLKLNAWAVLCWQGIGRFVRYCVIAQGSLL